MPQDKLPTRLHFTLCAVVEIPNAPFAWSALTTPAVECRAPALHDSDDLACARFPLAFLPVTVVYLEEVCEIAQFAVDRLKVIQGRAARLYRLVQDSLDRIHQ